MTTNITPIEALEKIKEMLTRVSKEHWHRTNILEIIDQALALQECDVINT